MNNITAEWLCHVHPNITLTQACSLFHYCFERGIHNKECYGRGENIFKKWMNEQNLITDNCGGLVKAFPESNGLEVSYDEFIHAIKIVETYLDQCNSRTTDAGVIVKRVMGKCHFSN